MVKQREEGKACTRTAGTLVESAGKDEDMACIVVDK